MDETDRKLQQKHLEILAINGGVILEKPFYMYASGEIGPHEIHADAVSKNGKDFKEAITDMRRAIELETYGGTEGIDVISGGESRDWIFSFSVAEQMGLAPAMIYKDGRYFGPNLQNKNVVHVADLSDEGSSPRDLWVPAIRKRGGVIEQIFFYVDRMEEGPRVMEKLGLESHALVYLDENAWNYLLEKRFISKEKHKMVLDRGTTKEQRDAWAIKMLRSDKGKERLRQLYNDPKEHEKVKKVISHYKELTDELKEAVNKV